MRTLRDRLREESPLVPLKLAWRVQIRAARAAARRQGHQLRISSRKAVEQALGENVEPEADVAGLKDALRRLLAAEGEDRAEVAVEVNGRICAMISAIASEPVSVVVTGWPEWLSLPDRSRILGRPIQSLTSTSPSDAAHLVRELDGLHLGGATLLVQVGLKEDERLPAVARGQRARPRARGTRPWLPFLDEQGRFSLTPEKLAHEHGVMLESHGTVIDAFCGCGGDAIAMALEGLRVIAIDSDPGRLELAEQNASAKGVAERIQFLLGSADAEVPALMEQHPEAAIYLDPPWGGVDWDRSHQTFDDLAITNLFGACASAPQVLIKAPRALDTATLPDIDQRWRVRPAWNPNTASPAEQVLFLRVLAKPD